MNVTDLGSCTLTELALSADNVMVWALLMDRIGVPRQQQRRVVGAGVGIAVAMRVAAIAAGAAALERVAWLTYALGFLLIWTGARIIRPSEDGDTGRVIRVLARWLRSPSVLGAVSLGMTDIVFAVDSIPASFGITTDKPTIILANGIALAGLVALFPGITALVSRLRYLNYGLAAVMLWLGVGMLAHGFVTVPEWADLAVIGALLGAAGMASLLPQRSAGYAAR